MKVIGQSTLYVEATGEVLLDTTNMVKKKTGKLKNPKLSAKKKDNKENSKSGKDCHPKFVIHVDEPISTKCKTLADIGVQTEVGESSDDNPAKNKDESVQKTIEMLTSEKPPYEYWERLAEQRRIALNISIEENEAIREENEALRRENENVKEDNKLLEEMIQEAKELALFFKNLPELQEES